MILEYVFLKQFLVYTVWFQVVYFILAFIIMKILYKNKANVTDIFPLGTYLITMNGHITVAKDGTIYDTFDCRDRVVRSAWEVI